jgi:hypothetical protein
LTCPADTGWEARAFRRGRMSRTVALHTVAADNEFQDWHSEYEFYSLDDAVRAQAWYREFREIVLMFAISNIEQLCDPL